ncbi:MAG: hypothetical protein LBR71_01335 [Synergistaceae bacterium]|jgi:hypothetical protein|nr:hypothetical protein [Synergistaceae bacterium]
MITSNRKIVAKDSITSANFRGDGKGGYLNPEQSKEFLRMMFDATDFLKDIQTFTMRAPTKDLDYMKLDSRIIRPGVEGVAPDEIFEIDTAKQTLTTTEVILPFDITDNVLEDIIEGGNADENIAKMMTDQFGNDLCDLSLNGDTSVTGGVTDEKFLKIGDGFVKIAKGSADTHKFNTGGSTDYRGDVFPALLAALPNRYKRRKSELRFYVSPSVSEAYIRQLAIRETKLGDESLVTGMAQRFSGIQLFECEFMPDDVLILTSNKNLATGIFRDVKAERERSARERKTKYTVTMRLDPAKIIWHDALVIGYNISARPPVETAPIKVEVTNIEDFPVGSGGGE